MSNAQNGAEPYKCLISNATYKGCTNAHTNKSVPPKFAKRMLRKFLSCYFGATTAMTIAFNGMAVVAEIELMQMTAKGLWKLLSVRYPGCHAASSRR